MWFGAFKNQAVRRAVKRRRSLRERWKIFIWDAQVAAGAAYLILSDASYHSVRASFPRKTGAGKLFGFAIFDAHGIRLKFSVFCFRFWVWRREFLSNTCGIHLHLKISEQTQRDKEPLTTVCHLLLEGWTNSSASGEN
jgi:hypothetical protein